MNAAVKINCCNDWAGRLKDRKRQVFLNIKVTVRWVRRCNGIKCKQNMKEYDYRLNGG